jgi:hypothetical protein
MAQGTQYEVTVTSAGRKTPLLRYRGPVDRVSGLTVERLEDDELQLVYTNEDGSGPGVILGIAKDPGGDLTLERVELDDELKPRGKPVTKAV